MNETKILSIMISNYIEEKSLTNTLRRILSVFVAMILLVAAGMKAQQLATVPLLGEGLLHARWFNILVVEFELFFGIWLIFGKLPKLSWFVTVCCFSIFATVSFYKAVSGETSCGCFGTATVNPWITTCFDLFVIAFLVALHPKDITINLSELFREAIIISKQGQSLLFMFLVWFFIATPVTYSMISAEKRSNAELGAEFIGADGKKTILLEPEKWIGNEFPLLPYFTEPDQADAFRDGYWMFLLFHHECPKCSQVKSKIEESNIRNIVFIELPPYDQSSTDIAQNNIRLSADTGWFAETPVLLIINNSIVEKVIDDMNYFE